MKKAYLNWSSGKDAAVSLYKLRQGNEYSVEKLLTTVNTRVNRISMHGVREELLQMQAESIGLPLHTISLHGEISIEAYNEIMEREIQKLVNKGFTHSVFGDILLEDLKTYREKQLKEIGLDTVFPLWHENTYHLLKEFINLGFRAIVVCVNANKLDKSFCGRELDDSFLEDLPKGVDPCGENGEYHTFVFDGPIFKKPIPFEIGEIVQKSYTPSKGEEKSSRDTAWDFNFWYCDLKPA